jgi:hypothetical protein
MSSFRDHPFRLRLPARKCYFDDAVLQVSTGMYCSPVEIFTLIGRQKAPEQKCELNGMKDTEDVVAIGTWVIESPDPSPRDAVAKPCTPSRKGSCVSTAREPINQFPTPTIEDALRKSKSQIQDAYRWSGIWFIDTSAQHSHQTSSEQATNCPTLPRKLHKRHESRGLSDSPSVSETKAPGQLKTLAREDTPRSSESLELGALDDQSKDCDDLSFIFKRWMDQCTMEDPWYAPDIGARIAAHKGLLDDDGSSRRGSALEICD